MRRRKRLDSGGGGNEWMNTYADMVTLLLTFFAVLLSMSTVSQDKFNAFIRSFSNLPPEQIEEILQGRVEEGEEEPTPDEISAAIDSLYKKLKDYVKKNGKEEEVSIHKTDNAIFVRFDSRVFFEPDKYVIREGGYETLSFIGKGLKEYQEMIKVVAICGHTADIGDTVNSPISDWMLSGERSAVVSIFLEDEVGIDPQKLLLIGYGKNLPISDNSTEAGRRANRRVELAVISRNSTLSFNPYEGLSDLYDLSSGGESESTVEETEKPTPLPAPSPVPSPVPSPAPSPLPTQSVDEDDIQKDVSPYD